MLSGCDFIVIAAPLTERWRAVLEKRNRGTGLDVFEREPLPTNNAHWVDHMPGWTEAAIRFFLEQHARFEKNELLLNSVNKRVGY
jgi:phosphoglycerate dehydrogenase-like enzyme